MPEPSVAHAHELLQAKVVAPPLRLQHALRQRLVDKMRADGEARLVLVSAPAGYGKTSYLSEWAQTVRASGAIIAWYSLDEEDNDPARFAAYLAEAVRIADPELMTELHTDPPADLQLLATRLCNGIASRGKNYFLVLDDFHLITTPLIYHVVSGMCDFLPKNMQLVIGTRADPPLPLARLRARNHLTEIRASDLSFTRDETTLLLQSAIGWTPSPAALDQLTAVAEGWAAALALIVMTLRRHGRTPDYEQALVQQLAGYSRTQRHLFAYFAAEVLEQQSAQIREFLLDTCVLERLDPFACSALSDDPRASLTLHNLANANLFLLPLAESEPVYRYHPLFREFLIQHLALHDGDRLLKQHRRAAEWYAAQGQATSAVAHALEANDQHFAARLVEDVAWPSLTSRGEIETIVRWLPRFSEEDLRHFPRLTLYFSRSLYLTGNLEQSAVYVNLALAALDRGEFPSDDSSALRAIALGYQATLAAYRGEIVQGLLLIERAEALQEWASALDRVRIANTHAFLHFLRGDVTLARRQYERALEAARHLGHHYLALDAIGYLAQLDLMEGKLRCAQARCDEALAQYPTPIAPLSTVMLPLANVYFEQNRIDEAESLARDAIDLAQGGKIPDLLWRAHALLAMIVARRGDSASALAEAQRAEQVAGGFRSPFMLDYIGAVQARILLFSGNVERAVTLLERAYSSGAWNTTAQYQRDFESMVQARIWLKIGRRQEALALLEQTRIAMEESGRLGNLVEARLLEAAAHQALGRAKDAVRALTIALQQAAPEDQMRAFLEQDESLRPLLEAAIVQGIEPDFAHKILAVAPGNRRYQISGENLTQREIEVLQEIALGRSNQEIAEALILSLGTVKSHLNHIMGKLDARNRTEAVARARAMNLLDE